MTSIRHQIEADTMVEKYSRDMEEFRNF